MQFYELNYQTSCNVVAHDLTRNSCNIRCNNVEILYQYKATMSHNQASIKCFLLFGL